MGMGCDERGIVVQGFAPFASKTLNITIADGSDYVIDVTKDVAILIYASGNLALRLDSSSSGFPIPAGMQFGIVTANVRQIVLANATGGDVDLYALRQ